MFCGLSKWIVGDEADADGDLNRDGDWAWSTATDKFSAKESASPILEKEYRE